MHRILVVEISGTRTSRRTAAASLLSTTSCLVPAGGERCKSCAYVVDHLAPRPCAPACLRGGFRDNLARPDQGNRNVQRTDRLGVQLGFVDSNYDYRVSFAAEMAQGKVYSIRT